MDRCQAEARLSTSRPSPAGRWCPQRGADLSPCPGWSPSRSVTGPVTTGPGRSTPPIVTTPTPHPRPNLRLLPYPGLSRATIITSDQSALTQSRVRVSRLLPHRVVNVPDGCCAIIWGAGRPPHPPPRPQNKATPSAPPQVPPTTALSFLTHFPTRGQLVFQ